ncbi:MAG TPA: ABC transporter permease subunit [Methanosarcinaceae archaeon]|nr:ABC transporter permease subunit [Methanosarcinaceae archaeon]
MGILIKQKPANIKRADPLMLLFYILSLVLLLFVFVVIANMIIGQVLTDFSGLLDAASSKPVLKSIFLSLYAGFLATMISLLLGVPTAYILARNNFIGKRFVESMLDVPVVIPHTVAGIALLTVFGSNGLIGAPLEPYIQFRDAMPGIVVAMLFVSAPYLTNSAREGFKNVDPKLENVARSLGAPFWKTFAIVTLPLASRHLLIGSIMCWARAISEFGAVVMIAYYPMIGPTLIYDRYLSQGLTASRPIAVLLILVTLVIFLAVRILSAGWRVYDKD